MWSAPILVQTKFFPYLLKPPFCRSWYLPGTTWVQNFLFSVLSQRWWWWGWWSCSNDLDGASIVNFLFGWMKISNMKYDCNGQTNHLEKSRFIMWNKKRISRSSKLWQFFFWNVLFHLFQLRPVYSKVLISFGIAVSFTFAAAASSIEQPFKTDLLTSAEGEVLTDVIFSIEKSNFVYKSYISLKARICSLAKLE